MTEDPIARMKEDFIGDAAERVNKLYRLLASLGPGQQPTRDEVDQLFRAAHSLKGTAAMFDLASVSRVAASVENILEAVRSGASRLEPDMAELLLEAFDEMLLIFRSARGEAVSLRTDDLVTRIDRLVASMGVNPGDQVPEEEAHDPVLAEILSDLTPAESECLKRWMKKRSAIFRIRLYPRRIHSLGGEEAAIRRLQENGEVVSVVPESHGEGAGTLGIVYALTGQRESLDAFSEEFNADITETGSQEAPERAGYAGAQQEPEPEERRDEGDKHKKVRSTGPRLTVKVDIRTLDSVMNTLSELYSVRLGLLGVAKRVPSTTATRRIRDDLLKLGLLLNKRVVELEESIIDARLEPVSILFDRFRGEVRRLAKRSGKKVHLRFEGEATRVDRAMLSRLYDPLLHIIRNAIDHGIESETERSAAGKPEEGCITLRARQEASHICIDVEDDGSGIDVDKVRQAAYDKGLEAEGDQAPLMAIFEAGVSTNDDVTDISGRGVGLDVVKSQIEEMRGLINVDTSVGRGTTFSIWMPLTLAVSRGILLDEGDVPVVVPLGSVVEVIALTRSVARDSQENGMLSHNGSQVEVVNLSRMLKTGQCPDVRSAVILGIGHQRRALVSQKVCGETEIVSRPLPGAARAPGYIAGATELHDGRPAIVIQPEELLRASTTGAGRHAQRQIPVAPEDGSLPDILRHDKTISLLIFSSGHGYRALPLCLLREIVPLKSYTRLPVLGEQWLGLFFVRGLCHGLLSPEANGPRESLVARSAAILGFPDRCGVAIGKAIGHFEVPLEDLEPAGPDIQPGLVTTFARFRWENQDVSVLDIGGILHEHLAHPALP